MSLSVSTSTAKMTSPGLVAALPSQRVIGGMGTSEGPPISLAGRGLGVSNWAIYAAGGAQRKGSCEQEEDAGTALIDLLLDGLLLEWMDGYPVDGTIASQPSATRRKT